MYSLGRLNSDWGSPLSRFLDQTLDLPYES